MAEAVLKASEDAGGKAKVVLTSCCFFEASASCAVLPIGSSRENKKYPRGSMMVS